MKKFLSLCGYGAISGLLFLPACSSSNNSTSSTTDNSVVTIPDGNIVITAEQAATLIGKTESVAEAEAHSNGELAVAMENNLHSPWTTANVVSPCQLITTSSPKPSSARTVFTQIRPDEYINAVFDKIVR